MEALLRERKKRGLTYKALSAESGIPLPTLTWWAQRFRKESETGSRQAFVELKPPRQPVPIEIVIRDVRIVVRPGFDAKTLRAAVAALGC